VNFDDWFWLRAFIAGFFRIDCSLADTLDFDGDVFNVLGTGELKLYISLHKIQVGVRSPSM
jgi:hypothetical protein